jgi:hypothetical protein
MAVSTWLAQRNEKARARLMRNLPEVFPGGEVRSRGRPAQGPSHPDKTLWPYREALAKASGERAGRLGWLAGHEKLAAIVGV